MASRRPEPPSFPPTGAGAVSCQRLAGNPKVLCVFGTRPEIIKLAPIIQELRRNPASASVRTLSSGQHTDLLEPLLELFDVWPDFDLQVMRSEQSPNEVCARALEGMGPIIREEAPDLIVVQGDTTTALAAAMSGFHYQIPVAHVEAGLRSGDSLSPFPEEMNRRLITRLAKYHFAATAGNRAQLLEEGVPAEDIFVTGNPVVDSLHYILENSVPSDLVGSLLQRVGGRELMVLTTHRRENFGGTMQQNLREIRGFVEAHEELSLIFAVHPNPNVVQAAKAELASHPRVHLINPLGYADFIQLVSHAWLLLSDSGGIQEEAPSLGKPLLILRNNTERPEAIQAGTAFLVGDKPGGLTAMLDAAYGGAPWLEQAKQVRNPFGDGKAAQRISRLILNFVASKKGATCEAAG